MAEESKAELEAQRDNATEQLAEANATIAELREERKFLRAQQRALEDRNADLVGQIDWHSKAITISPEQQQAMRDEHQQFLDMNAQQNVIARFLRDHYADEIASGQHNGRTLAEIICGYLGQLKQATAPKRSWWQRLFDAE